MTDRGEALVDPGLCRDTHCVSLLTDFGTTDGYVGAVKGVLLSTNPRIRLVDLTHGIEPHDVEQAAYVLGRHYRSFPRGTVHFAVVDPGVGGSRRALVVESVDYLFVGPDNGIFSPVYDDAEVHVFEVGGRSLMPYEPSDLFHARDIFAPIAGRLTLGLPPCEVGPPLEKWVRLPLLRASATAGGIEGHVIYIDRFGNCVTNIPADLLRSEIGPEACAIEVADLRIEAFGQSYESVDPGELLGVVGSSGYLEISANRAKASELLQAARGCPVRVIRR